MAHTFLLQDWTHLQATTQMVQDDSDWIDLAQFTDVVFYTSVKHFTGTAVTVHFQTSPSKDETLFAAMASRTASVSDRLVDKVLFASASEPLARWARWRLTGTGAFEITFRIWVAAISTG